MKLTFHFWYGVSQGILLTYALVGILALVAWCLGFFPSQSTNIPTLTDAPVIQGKRRSPGVMSQETLKSIELQTARELFSGKMRDPFTERHQ